MWAWGVTGLLACPETHKIPLGSSPQHYSSESWMIINKHVYFQGFLWGLCLFFFSLYAKNVLKLKHWVEEADYLILENLEHIFELLVHWRSVSVVQKWTGKTFWCHDYICASVTYIGKSLGSSFSLLYPSLVLQVWKSSLACLPGEQLTP